MRLTFTTAGTAALALLAPVIVHAADYLTAEQAQKAMFPEADRFTPQNLSFDATRLQAIEKLSGLPARSANWQVLVARKGEQTAGYVVIDNVVGKFELITYAVALNTDGSVRQVEVLSYRESHGYEIRLPAWRKQFAGKSIKSPLRVGNDIANISGATLSCNHVTDGVRRIVALVKTALDSKLLA
jgi:Na+-translocating ferredoxin:NAD+ oxidoreductase RnfG subunit